MNNVISFTSVVLVSSCQTKSYLLAGRFKQFSVQNNRSRGFFVITVLQAYSENWRQNWERGEDGMPFFPQWF